MPVCNLKTIRLKLQEKRHFTVTIYYTIISKFKKFAKNSKIIRSSKKSTSQVSDIILDACMQFKNSPITTVGEEAFYTYYILYHYFKTSKIRQKIKIIRLSKKNTSQVSDIILDSCMQFENYPIKTAGEEAFYSYYILYHILKFQKFAKNSKIIRSSKKHKPG